MANSLDACGWSSLALSDPVRAAGCFLESLDIAGHLGSPALTADSATGLAASLVALHQEQEGARLLAAAAAANAELNRDLERHLQELRDGAIARARLALGEEAFAAAWERGEAVPLEQAVASARAVAADAQAEAPRA